MGTLWSVFIRSRMQKERCHRMPKVTYDSESDFAYVVFREGPDAHSIPLGSGRVLEVSSSGDIVGVEFERASQGVQLMGLPVDYASLAQELQAVQVPVLDVADWSVSMWGYSPSASLSLMTMTSEGPIAFPSQSAVA